MGFTVAGPDHFLGSGHPDFRDTKLYDPNKRPLLGLTESFPERAIVSALRVPEGDFRDWTEIRQWAADIAGALGAGSSPRAVQGQRPRPCAGHQKFCP